MKKPKMTMRAALANELLKGHVLTTMSCAVELSITNCPREISRTIEQFFNVEVSRTRREKLSKYGEPVFWYEYRLNRTEYNREGIKAMEEYVAIHIPPKKKLEPLAPAGIQGSFF